MTDNTQKRNVQNGSYREDPEQIMTNDAGISEDDRAELLKSIELVASENKIEIDETRDSAFVNAKSGVAFPILVNIFSIIVVAVVVFVLSQSFQNNTESLVQSAIEFSSLENQLIREIQQQSQGALFSKDNEIVDYEQRIVGLDEQLLELEADTQSKVNTRRAEYEIEIQSTLDAERARLIEQGITLEEVDRLLAIQENELRSYYSGLLQDYEVELLAEQSGIEEDIIRLRNEYLEQLAVLESERDQIVSEFRAQEVALRSQLESQTQLLENASEEALEDLSNARNEIANLEATRERVANAESQLLGLYTRLQDALNSAEFTRALEVINQARTFLNERSILNLESFAERRSVDIFVLNTIEQFVQNSIESDVVIDNVSSQLEVLQRIRSNNERALVASNSGDSILALDLYSNTMSLLPELQIASDAIAANAQAQVQVETIGQLDTERSERIDTINNLVQNAGNAVSVGNYAGALASYEEALQSVQEFETLDQEFESGLLAIGYSLANQVVSGQVSASSNSILSSANINTSATINAIEAQIERAIAQREEELQSLHRREIAALNEEFERTLEEDRLNLLSLSDSLSEDLNIQIEDLGSENTQLLNSLLELTQQVDTLETEVSVLNRDISGLSQQNAEFQRVAAESEAELARLSEFQTQLAALRRSYDDYRERVREIRQDSTGDVGFRLQGELETFVGYPEFNSIFPDFRNEIRSNYPYFIEGGREEGLGISKDIVSGFVSQASPEQGILFLETELQFAREDANGELVAFLTDILESIQR